MPKQRSTPTAGKPSGLRARKKVELKRRIAETTLGLVRERGYAATTIDEIVRRVDVSQPTFYKYYPSKDAVLLEHAMSGFAPLLSVALQQSGSIAERMAEFLLAVARQMTKDRELWRAIALTDAYNPIRNPELLGSPNATTRVLELAITEGQRLGEFTSQYSAKRLASLLEAMMFRICVEWGADFPKPHRLTDSVAEGFALFLRAAGTQQGEPARATRAKGRARSTKRD